ncbi:MAG TPA: tail fiber domain-containing protein [Brumimicrobium sp.]|nr:tail fiber domain-containing protein [Brumimicrobium sp.]
MKKLILTGITAFLFATMTLAQAPPQGVNYQAVAYDNKSSEIPGTDVASLPIANQAIKVRFTIIKDEATGNEIYSEEHTTTTDENGLFNLIIGKGFQLSNGDFPSIDWGTGLHFLKVDLDVSGSYNTMGTQQIWSVPYALYSEKSGNGVSQIINTGGNVTFNLENGETFTVPLDGADGNDGISINWLGTYTTAPASPVLNDSYYNSTDGVSYIWNGTAWQIVAQDGTDGIAGTNGLPGADGINMEWLGDFSNAPASPTLNQAYYNTTDGESYIWDGSAWQTVAKDGVGAGGPHNTLNQAYNEGGAGAGRVITANSGPVEINQTTSGTRALVVTTDAGSNASISIDAINNGTGLSIRGTNTNPSNTNATIQAESNTSNTNTSAILGQNLGAGYGVTGQIPATASGAAAVYGNNLSSTNNGIGVKGIGTLNGVEGETNNISGTGVIGANHGVFQGGATTNGIGTAGIGGIGIFGQAGGYGVNLAAYFSGNINVAGQGIATLGFFTASDERLKSEITPISNALERISNLSGYHYLFHSKVYDLKNDKTTESVSKQYGVIAQEVEKEFPEMVTNKAYFKTAGDDTEYKSVNYNELVPVLIEAIKELNDKVDTNQTEIEILKQKIKILESK